MDYGPYSMFGMMNEESIASATDFPKWVYSAYRAPHHQWTRTTVVNCVAASVYHIYLLFLYTLDLSVVQDDL